MVVTISPSTPIQRLPIPKETVQHFCNIEFQVKKQSFTNLSLGIFVSPTNFPYNEIS